MVSGLLSFHSYMCQRWALFNTSKILTFCIILSGNLQSVCLAGSYFVHLEQYSV